MSRTRQQSSLLKQRLWHKFMFRLVSVVFYEEKTVFQAVNKTHQTRERQWCAHAYLSVRLSWQQTYLKQYARLHCFNFPSPGNKHEMMYSCCTSVGAWLKVDLCGEQLCRWETTRDWTVLHVNAHIQGCAVGMTKSSLGWYFSGTKTEYVPSVCSCTQCIFWFLLTSLSNSFNDWFEQM